MFLEEVARSAGIHLHPASTLFFNIHLALNPKAISYGRSLRTEKSRFFRAVKPDVQNSVDNLIMTRVFQIVFRQLQEAVPKMKTEKFS